jgi:hypothetical protein
LEIALFCSALPCDVADWPVGAGAAVCANAVPPPIAEQRSIALTSDFIVNSFPNDEAPTANNREMIGGTQNATTQL